MGAGLPYMRHFEMAHGGRRERKRRKKGEGKKKKKKGAGRIKQT